MKLSLNLPKHSKCISGMLTERIGIIVYTELASMKTLVHILSTIYLDAFRKVNILLEECYRSMREIHS